MSTSSAAYLKKARKLPRAEAAALLATAVEIHTNDPRIYEALGSALWDIGEREQSVTAWSRAVDLQPDWECPRLILSHHLRELRRYAESIEVLSEGLQACPRSRSLWLREMAWVHAQSGDVPAAIALCDEALRLDPSRELQGACSAHRRGR